MTEEQKILIRRLNLKSGTYKVKKENGKFKLMQIKDDTSGCILLGKNTQKGIITESKKYVNLFIEILKSAINKGETVTLKIE